MFQVLVACSRCRKKLQSARKDESCEQIRMQPASSPEYVISRVLSFAVKKLFNASRLQTLHQVHRDLFAVKSPVLDKNFAGLSSGHYHSSNIDSGDVALKSARIADRAHFRPCQLDPEGLQKLVVRVVSRQCEDKIILQQNFTFGSAQAN